MAVKSAIAKAETASQTVQEQWEKGFAGCVENRVAFLTAKQGYSKAFAAVDHRSIWNAPCWREVAQGLPARPVG